VYVCICAAVSDRQIASAVAAGADSLEQLGFELGVGTGCGCCRETAQRMLDARACHGDCARCPDAKAA
jgi:bacterioferritin-associated ferredoxin